MVMIPPETPKVIIMCNITTFNAEVKSIQVPALHEPDVPSRMQKMHVLHPSSISATAMGVLCPTSNVLEAS